MEIILAAFGIRKAFNVPNCKIYWKSIKNPIAIKDEASNKAPNTEEQLWVRHELYFLKNEDANILKSQTAWLNDRIMDAAQKLICKTLGEEDNYQSVLNTQKNEAIPYNPVYNDHIQLLHDGGSHWFLSFFFRWSSSNMRQFKVYIKSFIHEVCAVFVQTCSGGI